MTFSPDGTILAWGGDGRHIQLWDVKSRQPLQGFFMF
jgi:WD40 repeat protein